MIEAHIVLGAPIENTLELEISNDAQKIFIGVDKGALYLINTGIRPQLSLGDFDSITDAEFKKIEQQSKKIELFGSDKDDTDAELALELTETMFDPDLIYVHNWRGGRLDHLMSLLYLVHQPRFKHIIDRVKFVDTNNTLSYFKPGSYTIKQEKGKKYLSFIGIIPVKELSLADMKYPLDKEDFEYPIALISNEFTGKTAKFSFKEGIIAVIQSKD